MVGFLVHIVLLRKHQLRDRRLGNLNCVYHGTHDFGVAASKKLQQIYNQRHIFISFIKLQMKLATYLTVSFNLI